MLSLFSLTAHCSHNSAKEIPLPRAARPKIEEGAVEDAGARERAGHCPHEEEHAWDEARNLFNGLSWMSYTSIHLLEVPFAHPLMASLSLLITALHTAWLLRVSPVFPTQALTMR